MRILTLLFLFTTLSLSAQNEIPDVDLTTMGGETVNFQEVTNDGNVKIVSLWATWCVPCLKELDAINDVYEDWQDETQVELIAISIDDSRTVKRVKPLINGKAWDYKILLDTNNDLKRALGAATVPLTLVVKDNKIVYRHSGYNPGSENELYEVVQKNAN
ncbi:MAG: TlpA family protein disulfide reductase [Flavobacteriaceae bacterium]|nr:TlpA family protein disulfide reductase [Flavobacteriaceae bacterium]